MEARGFAILFATCQHAVQ